MKVRATYQHQLHNPALLSSDDYRYHHYILSSLAFTKPFEVGSRIIQPPSQTEVSQPVTHQELELFSGC